MKVFLDSAQEAHHPQNFLHQGVIKPSPESPERIELLRKGAEDAGASIHTPPDAGFAPIAAVHDARYLTFLQTIHERWKALPGAAPEVIPNVHPRARSDGYPSSAVGQAGYHQADTACPIGPHTYMSAYASAQSAIAATDAVLAGERHAYALCRPPGHHAYADQAGGFCFLNNSAIAAQRLLDHGMRPAILDVDVHHGNGTQGIFYARGDVLTVSIHADPDGFYPFFWGHADELGEKDGVGANLNLPLARGSDNVVFLGALDRALTRIADFGATAIVVALGLDAHEDDPFQGLALSTDGFTLVAAAISTTGLPLVLVQEGGYVSDALGHNLTAFFEGL
ncbi:histone deacetylase family protein [Roseovarius rhodophyticola]|uniref:Histone deacetylase family protein n=1 Tax=Roseovarius rhodophyticola TaxID=3080827 RepID=A0ABZ2TIA7_9RHOB|nr:histone deacetylase family protein [Roseovarius sp. W115]MDV2929300.1 histone deacetylase family protein [Roseovarius sp. W115]